MTPSTEYDAWLANRFEAVGPFTLLIVLVSIGDTQVDLLRSTHLHVIGTETSWEETARLFDGARVAWTGAALFPASSLSPLVADAVAKDALGKLTERLHADRLVLNDGWFFDRLGRRLQIEEITATH